MNKVICDVCGTAYPETSSHCPICGCAKKSVDRTSAGEEDGSYAYVKGGRFSKKNVRKRASGAPQERVSAPARRPQERPEPKEAPEREKAEPRERRQKEEQPEEQSNTGLIMVVIFLLNYLLGLLHLDFWAQYWISLAAYAALIILMFSGPANPNTANDNTSGVITLLEIYESLSPQLRKDVCFVLFDNEEKGLLGSAQFRKKHKNSIKNTLMINFDCVSDGDHFLLGVNKAANQKYGEQIAASFTGTESKEVLLENLKKVYYPSDQAGFPMAVAVAALKYKKPFGFYMNRIHTKRDTVFQEENIAYLTERTIRLIENM